MVTVFAGYTKMVKQFINFLQHTFWTFAHMLCFYPAVGELLYS